ncbi:MAG: 6-phosphogluconolactonase [Rhodobacteraceae bacterium]|nr:6-phosphogluconolactonase [Paracoccaceae bacterium]
MRANYRSAAIQAQTLAAIVAGQLAEALGLRGRATLAVPGGSTPAAFLRALSGADIDWAKVDVLLTDERMVPESDPRSNSAMLRGALWQGNAAKARHWPLEEPGEDIRTLLPLDVCVLGMGADGHIASLFPGADQLARALDPDCAAIVLAITAPGAPEPRISLTARVLTGARHLHLLIAGADKAAALARAEQPGPTAEAPVRAILARDDLVIHYSGEG